MKKVTRKRSRRATRKRNRRAAGVPPAPSHGRNRDANIRFFEACYTSSQT